MLLIYYFFCSGSLSTACWRLGITPPPPPPITTMITTPTGGNNNNRLIIPTINIASPMGMNCQKIGMSTESSTKYKYALVRIPESNMVEFFSLVVSKGYSDVSFVSNLSHVNIRDDPNDDQPTTSGSVEEMSVLNDDDSTSENQKSTPRRPPSVQIAPKLEPQQQQPQQFNLLNPTAQIDADILTNGVPVDFFNNLFGKTDYQNEIKNSSSSTNRSRSNGSAPYSTNGKSDYQLQTRMKGWQREYIKEIINNGHYPSEQELRDIEQKCDLSRKQVLRFIAKRLVNPNRKPRINHHDEKRKEQEDRDDEDSNQNIEEMGDAEILQHNLLNDDLRGLIGLDNILQNIKTE
ncbi:unnamed protein product [Caenorhabditis angaria]|uniref:Homeobox domain-containing protein n=1 Tax=Caenorhabditis angaria TaxID=860376 RepID=A0A9P1IQ63_9PELO|nr:unnamed protein product [Caenorhabditis angaria]